MVVIIPGVVVEASPMVPPSSISTGGKGGSVFDEAFRKTATPIDELNELCFKGLAAKATTVEDLVAAAAAAASGSNGSVAEVSCASSTCSISGNLSDAGSSHITPVNNSNNNTAGGSEQRNAKLLKRTISRHGRSSQRWAADPLSHSAIRLTTGCVPIVEGGKVLFVSASSKPLWIFPKGGWENDEKLEESALRECFEEAGVIGVLGPKLTEVQYETRKSKKRRLETEETLKKQREKFELPLAPKNNDNSNKSKVVAAKSCAHSEQQAADAGSSGAASGPVTASAQASAAVVVDTTALKEPPTATAAHNSAAPVSDEAFARIRGEMLKNPKRHIDETSSVQSDASSYSQVRMCLFPLYVTSVKKEWPESGRLRRAVPIDEAIEILEARPELQAALKEVKEKGLHLLDGEGISSTDSKPTATTALPKVTGVR